MDMEIVGQKSFLSPLQEGDVQTLAKWASDPLLCNTYHNCSTLKENFLKECFEKPMESYKVYLINTMDNIAIGKLSVEYEEDNSANIDMVIAEKVYTGKGYGKDALKSIIKYGFIELGLNNIKVVFKEDNMRAEYCCWGCGLREDKYYIPGDALTNTSRMIIYKKDFIGY